MKQGLVLLNLKEELGEPVKGVFLKRKNRFVAIVKVNDDLHECHISDTGRLTDVLTPEAEVMLINNRDGLKTAYKLVATKKDNLWVLTNTLLHSKIAKRIIELGLLGFKPKSIQTEVKLGNSRIDFLIDGYFYLEVKGVTLSKQHICLFPDAPTERGTKHLKELTEALKQGFRTGVMMLCFVECDCFKPNDSIDMDFSFSFQNAIERGVEFYGFSVSVVSPTWDIVVGANIGLC